MEAIACKLWRTATAKEHALWVNTDMPTLTRFSPDTFIQDKHKHMLNLKHLHPVNINMHFLFLRKEHFWTRSSLLLSATHIVVIHQPHTSTGSATAVLGVRGNFASHGRVFWGASWACMCCMMLACWHVHFFSGADIHCAILVNFPKLLTFPLPRSFNADWMSIDSLYCFLALTLRCLNTCKLVDSTCVF